MVERRQTSSTGEQQPAARVPLKAGVDDVDAAGMAMIETVLIRRFTCLKFVRRAIAVSPNMVG